MKAITTLTGFLLTHKIAQAAACVMIFSVFVGFEYYKKNAPELSAPLVKQSSGFFPSAADASHQPTSPASEHTPAQATATTIKGSQPAGRAQAAAGPSAKHIVSAHNRSSDEPATRSASPTSQRSSLDGVNVYATRSGSNGANIVVTNEYSNSASTSDRRSDQRDTSNPTADATPYTTPTDTDTLAAERWATPDCPNQLPAGSSVLQADSYLETYGCRYMYTCTPINDGSKTFYCHYLFRGII